MNHRLRAAANAGGGSGSRPLIVGLGMATVDILAAVPRLPGRDEVFELNGLEFQGGGPAATAMVAAARLGNDTALLGTVDSGSAGSMIVRELEHEGVDTSGLLRRGRGVSSRSVILVEAEAGHRSILYSRGTVDTLEPSELPVDLLSRAALLHLDGFHPEAALEAAAIARASGGLVSFDGGAGRIWPGTEQILPLVDLLVVARDFARKFTGADDPTEACEALRRASGAADVVVTDGPRGAWFLAGEAAGHVPAFEVDAVDTTGAGDAFHGGYLHARLAGLAPAERVRFASAVAAIACTAVGGRTALPNARQVEDLLKNGSIGAK